MLHKNLFRRNPLSKQKEQNDTIQVIKRKLKKFKLLKCQISEKTCLDLFQEYMVTSSLHGLRYPVEKTRSIYERIFWIIVIGILVLLAIWLTIAIYISFVNAPTATSQVPKRRPITTVPFPAVTICDGNRISRTSLMKMAKTFFHFQNDSSYKIGRNVAQIYKNLRILGMAFDWHSDDYMFYELDNMHSFFAEIYGANYSVNSILKSLQSNCIERLSNCKWQGHLVPCDKLFFSRKTFIGHCCLFNYQRPTTKQFQILASQGKFHKEWMPLLVHGSGADMGLSVVIEHDDKDFSLSMQSTTATHIYIHDSSDFPDENSNSIQKMLMSVGEELFIAIYPRPVYGLDAMRDVPPLTRGCVFEDEIKLVYENFYSLSECFLKCQIDSIIDACRCYPFHFMKFYPNVPECQLSDILCLQSWTDKWENFELPDQEEGLSVRFVRCPHCLPQCNTISYNIKSSWGYITRTKSLGTKQDTNQTKHSVLKVFYEGAYVIEYEQTIIYTWDELLSMFGGLFGITIGASIISAVEIVYFVTCKFLTVFFKKSSRPAEVITSEPKLFWNELPSASR